MAYENQHQLTRITARYECLLFDVDDTLYPMSSGLSKQCGKNIEEYMVQKLGMGESKASSYVHYYIETMEHQWLVSSYAHGRLPYENLKPDSALRKLLLGLPIRKVIFSNAYKVHVAKVLRKLGIEDCFDEIIHFESLNPPNRTSKNITNRNDDREGLLCRGSSFTEIVNAINGRSVLPKSPIICKPSKDAFEQAFKMANIHPQKTLFFDDNIRNIQTAKNLGLHTVLVGSSLRTNGADYAMESIHSIRETFPELWDSNKKSKSSFKCSGKHVVKHLNYILKYTLGDITKTRPKQQLKYY